MPRQNHTATNYNPKDTASDLQRGWLHRSCARFPFYMIVFIRNECHTQTVIMHESDTYGALLSSDHGAMIIFNLLCGAKWGPCSASTWPLMVYKGRVRDHHRPNKHLSAYLTTFSLQSTKH